MSNAALMTDLSGNNPLPDLKAYHAAGFRMIGLKATEGEAYDWSAHNALTDAAHALGLFVVHYCFLHDENGAEQARYFLDRIRGHVHKGDRIAADAEAAGVDGTIVEDFVVACDADPIQKTTGTKGLIYGSPYFLRDGRIAGFHGWGLWLADYTTASSPVFIPPGFGGKYELWQFSQTSHVPGTALQVDLSRIATPPKQKLKRTDLTRSQQRRRKRWIKACNNRKHPPTPSAVHDLSAVLVATNHAKDIQP